MSKLKPLRIVDNFYQTSSFFPMPTVLISTLDDEGNTTVGAYSLVFPYYVAGKDYYAMILECRNSSNTAQNLLKRPYCALNFIKDDMKYFKEAVRLGFPGVESKEKMKDFNLTFEDSQVDTKRPEIIAESFQVFECSWVSELEEGSKFKAGELEGYEPPYNDFNGITSKFGAHFILRIDKILMEEIYNDAIIDGVKAKNFPKIPVDYGYRDNTHFWFSPSRKYKSAPIPKIKSNDISAVRYAADRTDPDVRFTDEACERLTKVPRIFLKTALQGCVKWAKENNVTEIGAKEMDIINDKRSNEKTR